jgi:dethiobiotin synthetase
MELRGLFITGTDTGVGKTHVAMGIIAALRSRGIRVGAYKPAVSGSVPRPDGPVWNDVERLRSAAGGAFPAERICPQRFHAPLAPPVAARQEGRQVDAELLRTGLEWWRNQVEIVIVEGAGGLLSPITETESVADLAVSLGFPLVIVARRTLGTINHTLLTLEAAHGRRLAVAGIILNQPVAPGPDDLSTESNPRELEKRSPVPILAILPHSSAGDLLHPSPLSTIDWVQLSSTRGIPS